MLKITFEMSNYYKGNDLDTARDVVEKIYLGKMHELKRCRKELDTRIRFTELINEN